MLRLSSSDRPDAYLRNAVAIWLIADGVASGRTAFLSCSLSQQFPRNLHPGRIAHCSNPHLAFSVAAPDPGRSVSSAGAVGLTR